MADIAATFDAERGNWDFDPHDPEITAENLYPTYAKLREQCPVAHGHRYGGYYMLTSYAATREAATNAEIFSSGGGVYLPAISDDRNPPLELDGPEHFAFRKVLSPLFNAIQARKMEPRIREIINNTMDTFIERGTAELISELVEPIPLTVITEKYGLEPGQTERIRRDALEYLDNTDGGPKSREIIGRMISYWEDLVRKRREEPADDLLSHVVNAPVEGFTPTDRQLAWCMFGLTFGGHDSTILALGSALAHLAEHPDLRDELNADRSRLPNAVEELLRLHAPLHNFRRDVVHEVELHGQLMEPGDRVLLGWGAANRDPEHFPDPDVAHFDRTNAREHMAFGAGRHTCMGQFIARAEIRIALETVLDRMPDFQLTEPVERTGLTGGGHHHGVERLSVSFTPGVRSS